MRRRTLLSFFAVVALLSTQIVGGAASHAGTTAVSEFPTLAPATIAYGLRAPGTVVRRSGNVTVTRIDLTQARATAVGTSDLYRVQIDGRYPPRALRYVVLAGDTPVAYGIPGGRLRSLRAVTADPA